MDYRYTEKQLKIREIARDFAQKELIVDVLERDEHSIFPEKHVRRMAQLGFLGMMVDPKWGGGGMDTISYVLAIEEISKIDASIAVIMSITNSLVMWGLETFGTDAQKEKYLLPLAKGEILGAFLLSESEHGSDVSLLNTSAIDNGDYYVLNGIKSWVSNANSASLYLVIAQTKAEKKHNGINAFIVEKNSEGIVLGPPKNKLGMRGSDTHSVIFNNVKVPKENRIGEDGFGFSFAMKALDGGRIGIASQSLGIASGAFELSIKYAKSRITFGTEIMNHQSIAFKIADMSVKIENARNLCLKAAWLKDQNRPYGLASAMAKLYASDIALEISTEAVQIHGGNGCLKEYHVERLMRDAKITQIYEGTSEIQKIVISRSIFF